MIDLASFYTTPVSAATITDASSDKAAPKQGGMGIFDMLLAQLEQQISNGETNGDENADLSKQKKPTSDGPLTSDNPSLNEDTRLSLMRVLAGNDRVADDVAQLDNIADLDLIAEIEQTLALNQQIFDNVMRAGTGNDDLKIDKETGEIVVPDVAKSLNLLESGDQLLSSDINAVIDDIDLNTTNLTPQQITLLQDIQNGIVPTEAQAEDAIEALNILQSSLIALAAPPQPVKTDTNNGTLAGTDLGTNTADTDANIDAKSNLIAANNNAAGAGNDSLKTTNKPETGAPLPFNTSDAPAEGEINFEQMLKDAAGKKYAGNPLASDASTTQSANSNAQNINGSTPQAAFNVLQAWPFGVGGSLYGPSSFSDQMSEQLGLSLTSGQGTAQGSLSALVSQAQSAAHPHPATQMVAATINKGAQAGMDTNISLRLDPPGLGRVQVEMTFSKDKTMKAVVKAETPETFMMLQRDAQILERALHDAGLDADSGLSFELAQDGEFMDQNNQRGGGHDQGGTGRGGNSNGDELEIIESTMTWRVDPNTGHTRYDIYA